MDRSLNQLNVSDHYKQNLPCRKCRLYLESLILKSVNHAINTKN